MTASVDALKERRVGREVADAACLLPEAGVGVLAATTSSGRTNSGSVSPQVHLDALAREVDLRDALVHSRLCGQAPSDPTDMAAYLLEHAMDSVGLNPDNLISTTSRGMRDRAALGTQGRHSRRHRVRGPRGIMKLEWTIEQGQAREPVRFFRARAQLASPIAPSVDGQLPHPRHRTSRLDARATAIVMIVTPRCVMRAS